MEGNAPTYPTLDGNDEYVFKSDQNQVNLSSAPPSTYNNVAIDNNANNYYDAANINNNNSNNNNSNNYSNDYNNNASNSGSYNNDRNSASYQQSSGVSYTPVQQVPLNNSNNSSDGGVTIIQQKKSIGCFERIGWCSLVATQITFTVVTAICCFVFLSLLASTIAFSAVASDIPTPSVKATNVYLHWKQNTTVDAYLGTGATSTKTLEHFRFQVSTVSDSSNSFSPGYSASSDAYETKQIYVCLAQPTKNSNSVLAFGRVGYLPNTWRYTDSSSTSPATPTTATPTEPVLNSTIISEITNNNVWDRTVEIPPCTGEHADYAIITVCAQYSASVWFTTELEKGAPTTKQYDYSFHFYYDECLDSSCTCTYDWYSFFAKTWQRIVLILMIAATVLLFIISLICCVMCVVSCWLGRSYRKTSLASSTTVNYATIATPANS